MPKACPYAMALSFDIASYPGIFYIYVWVCWEGLWWCFGWCGAFWVDLVILLVKNFAISGKVATFVTANEGYASWLKC